MGIAAGVTFTVYHATVITVSFQSAATTALAGSRMLHGMHVQAERPQLTKIMLSLGQSLIQLTSTNKSLINDFNGVSRLLAGSSCCIPRGCALLTMVLIKY